jgi:hypothetical protein
MTYVLPLAIEKMHIVGAKALEESSLEETGNFGGLAVQIPVGYIPTSRR